MADERLFSPLVVGGQELKNRIVLAPMTRARCDPTPDDDFDIKNSIPTDWMKDYYAQRASSGLLITEGTQISELGRGWMCAPDIEKDVHAEAWKKVTDAVHEKNGVIYCQLWHLGRQAHSSYHPSYGKTVSASAVKITSGNAKNTKGEYVEHEVPAEMTIDEIQQTIQEFVNAAKQSKAAGFDGVEIHSANGYLIDQFLQSCTNKRTDGYGGSMENRIRILKEIVEAMIAEGSFPANRIGFRISPNGNFGDMGSDDNDQLFPYLAKEMNKYGLAYIHMMDGVGFGFHNKCKVVTAFDIKKVWDGPLIVNVGLTKEMAEGLIRSGAADLAAFGRPYLANPDLVERFKNNWPLHPEAPYDTWWPAGAGAKGYSDWETYKPPAGETKEE